MLKNRNSQGFSPPSVRIVIAGDHELIRAGLAVLLAREAGFLLCGSARDDRELEALMMRSQPHLLLLDLLLGHRDGLCIIKEFRERHPSTRILALGTYAEEVFATRTRRAGAAGYLRKDATGETLMSAIRAITAGESYGSVRTGLLAGDAPPGRLVPSRKAGESSTLSDRERHVFQLIGLGLGTGQIAEKLRLSRKTIETYREKIKIKLGYTCGEILKRSARSWIEWPARRGARHYHPAKAGERSPIGALS
jgi:DNA-binding NarL/FixJ family response regulator